MLVFINYPLFCSQPLVKVATSTFNGLDQINPTTQSLYPSTVDLKAAFSSGAITTSKDASPKRTFGGGIPLIDRSSKPKLPSGVLDVEVMNAKNNAVSYNTNNTGNNQTGISLNETLNSTRLGVDNSSSNNSVLDNAIRGSNDQTSDSYVR